MSNRTMLRDIPRFAWMRSRRLRVGWSAAPPELLILLSMLSVQFGAALAKQLFPVIGPSGVVFMRIGFAALFLVPAARPWRRARSHTRLDYLVALLFGLSLAGMTLAFYQAIQRLPLGVAVTLEFVGPLGVALAGSRRVYDLLWVGLALSGVICFAPWPTLGGARTPDLLGMFFAIVAGACWAGYIILNARVGQAFPGSGGLALSLLVAALALAPIGVLSGGLALFNPHTVLVGLGVALLSSLIPFSLELEALRRLPTRIFGILMSLEPATATLVGLLTLHEGLTVRASLALALVTLASLGATVSRRTPHPPLPNIEP